MFLLRLWSMLLCVNALLRHLPLWSSCGILLLLRMAANGCWSCAILHGLRSLVGRAGCDCLSVVAATSAAGRAPSLPPEVPAPVREDQSKVESTTFKLLK